MAAPIPNPQPYPEIPDKLYFRIGEVSQLAGVKPYVLRYWETEFAGIGPKKSGSNHRLYRRKDVELILDIKHLLYEKRYTIEGARKLLMGEGRSAARAESRALAKPVQAASAMPAAVAVAVGAAASGSGSASPMAASPMAAGQMAAGPAAAAVSAAAVSAMAASVSAATKARGAVAGEKLVAEKALAEKLAGEKLAAEPVAAQKAPAVNIELLGSIRKELTSLLDLLAR